jgi:hypothetical protein
MTKLAVQHRQVTRQHTMKPPAATAKQHGKTAPTLSANGAKQKTSEAENE